MSLDPSEQCPAEFPGGIEDTSCVETVQGEKCGMRFGCGEPCPDDLFCRLTGTVGAFDAETLAELYPNHGRYVNQVCRAANRLVSQRFLLSDDARQLRQEAAKSGVGRRP